MSIPNLPVDFKDDILNTGVNQKRKYQQTYNSDGSVSFEDVTAYQQKGSNFGAQEVNETNGAVNNIYAERIVGLDELDLVTEPGFFVDALAVKELNDKLLDSGWVNCKLGNGMSASSQGPQPAVRKIGNVVYLSGVAQTDKVWSTHDSIITIPDGYRPDRKRTTVQKGRGTYSYRLVIRTDGVCEAGNIVNDSGGNETTLSGDYFWFCDCWTIANPQTTPQIS